MKLLTPLSSGPVTYANRVFMAPLTRSRVNNPGRVPGALQAEYYRQRASAGLLISEGVNVSPRATGYVDVPGLWSEEQVAGWKKVGEAVHEAHGLIFPQLWHVGRISHPDFHDGELPMAPSAINPERRIRTKQSGVTQTVTPKAMTVADIKQTVEDFKQAGANAMAAGLDGVEIHSSNGYLFHQFFSTCSNTRTDEYGGSRENRVRFLFEVIEALRSVMPEERIGLRLNPMMHDAGGIEVNEETLPTFDHIITELNAYDLAYVHLTRPFEHLESPHFVQDVIGHYRKLYKGILIANGYYTPEEAENEVSSGRADAIVFGRPFISNPDLPERIKNGWPLVEADNTTFYSPGPEGYTDYPPFKA